MMTVNAELSAKTEMLTKANDDLKNYLNRTDIAIIFLDEELNIRSYTPATTDVFNIRDIDIGRPLHEITSRLAYEGVVDDAREVLRTLAPKGNRSPAQGRALVHHARSSLSSPFRTPSAAW